MFVERIAAERKKLLKSEFKSFLVRLNSKGAARCNTENEVQKYLEANSELIPMEWMLGHGIFPDVVISKLRLGPFISDFAYLTKNTGEWYIVLIELEDPLKPIFVNSKKRVYFSAKFNQALGQIESWRTWLRRKGTESRRLFEGLHDDFAKKKLFFKFILVYGRDAEFRGSLDRTERFIDKSTDDMWVITYDSLRRRLDNPGSSFPKNIVSVTQNSLEMKLLNDPETFIFSYLNSYQLHLSSDHESMLVERGYDVASWRSGELLTVNYKLPSSKSQGGFHAVSRRP